jgi:hypothetical protein
MPPDSASAIAAMMFATDGSPPACVHKRLELRLAQMLAAGLREPTRRPPCSAGA